MSTVSELADAAALVRDTYATLVAAREGVATKNDELAAMLADEQAAIDAAYAVMNAARPVAEEAVGLSSLNATLDAAYAAYYEAKSNFEEVMRSFEPLE